VNSAALSLAAFYLVGDRSGLSTEQNRSNTLRPALFANYRDLSRLRYDYPLVLVDDEQGGQGLRSLTDCIDTILRKIAPQGIGGEEIRRQTLSLEQEIRNLVARGEKGSLSSLWEMATQTLLFEANEAVGGALQQNLAKVQGEMGPDGEIVGCTAELPVKLFKHTWQQSQQNKVIQLRSRIDRLIQKLSDILRVNDLHSREARDATHLERALGAGDPNIFDFKAMARILKSAPVGDQLPAMRQQRIKTAMAVLESQEFITTGDTLSHSSFIYEDCSAALAAFQQHLPELTALVKAIGIAELEIENRYDEAQHDFFFSQFDEDQLGPGDLKLFPSYLVCLQDGDDAANQQAGFELLRSGLPFKIVVLSNSIIGDLETAGNQLSCGIRGQQLASMAMGLNNVFVLQSSIASLYKLREQVMRGMVNDRPALFSVYSGISGDPDAGKEALHPYLLAAAATESRIFPCLVYDPAAGQSMASRFHLDGNPVLQSDWCRHTFSYEDGVHHRQSEETAFTPIDFMVCDERFARHFAAIPAVEWSSNMLPVDSFLKLDSTGKTDHVPYVLVIDTDNVLRRAVCDEKLIEAAQRCLGYWHTLQELGGINNSHVKQALDSARNSWQQQQSLSAGSNSAVSDTHSSTTVDVSDEAEEGQSRSNLPPTVESVPEEVSWASPDDPWIETIRCTTCNECTQLNDRMFAYNEDKRAFIADSKAGTYRELVEAAENCQVAIIHPGKPINPDEPNLDELMDRAQPFNQ